MTKRVRGVTATVGDSTRHFQLRESALRTLTMQGLDRPFALWHRITHGEWSTDDLYRVFQAAIDRPTKPSGLEARQFFADEPPGNLAFLAALILEAFLFGIAQDRASWDVREPFPAPPAAPDAAPVATPAEA